MLDSTWLTVATGGQGQEATEVTEEPAAEGQRGSQPGPGGAPLAASPMG
jgi:hypothetical protein